jgi:glutaminyl-peptide cyclotransferase
MGLQEAVYARKPRGSVNKVIQLRRFLGIVGMMGLLAGCVSPVPHSPTGTSGITVVSSYPHDPSAFTQGLTVYQGRMYEGTGEYGNSSLRRVDVSTGKTEQLRPLDPSLFGEGIVVQEDRVYQLTWKNNLIFIYDLATFSLLDTVVYPGEGWGLTSDGDLLILSDGTSSLKYIDPSTFKVTRQVTVHEGSAPVDRLNELEYVNGEIWANIWYEDRIARISPLDGHILGWIDLSGLYDSSERSREAVANGIAFDPDSGRIFITGKYWPKLFEIEPLDP